MWPTPVTLSDTDVTLAPLSHDHLTGLQEAVVDGEIHRLWYTSVPAPDRMEAEITRRLALQDAGSMLPLSVLTPDGKPVGMTTYMNIDAANRRLEIGSTWYCKSVQRGPINTQAKRLLLTHAFQNLDCIAVEFRTHFMNRQSRAAIERLGAKCDGVLRSHMLGPEGALRDTVVYSIIASEWPTVRQNLTWALEKSRKQAP
ncbi:GNAT family N-acetyltransferase [Aliiroseovarius crassostreae]|uniref:GNAT family N-acetyltransferase n=1 Tax=Aliiroseovarius crassostreae TaxID=154981 RepID=UPI0021FD0E2B|nr:GNAT family protein [Aliiroseovarius crassostreae]UWP99369.1 GNAT family N-acetyltransferase [Aliiroseovarius crassostreae]